MAPFTLSTTLPLPTGPGQQPHPMPALGFGVYQTPPGETAAAVAHALRAGYRHIDSAVFYHNEAGCAEAIRAAGLARGDVFFTTKIPPPAMSHAGAAAAVDASLAATGLEYIDLYLLHSPMGGREGRAGAWRALVEAQRAGKIRAIGVSNFGVRHLEELEADMAAMEAAGGPGAGGVVAVNQIEVHPWCARAELVEWCRARGIVVQAWSPLVRNERMDAPVLQTLAAKHGKTPAQILLRWSLQKGYSPLPKSVTPSRIEQNADLYDFELDESDMKSLNDVDEHFTHPVWNPADTVE